MTVARRQIMWPLLIMAIGAVWLLAVAGIIPDAVRDLLRRAWPALLFLFAFDALVGRRHLRVGRVGLEANWLGLLLTMALVGGTIWFAYQQQADVQRTENVQTLDQTLSAEVAQVRVEAQVLRTSVTVAAAEAADAISARYTGSRDSRVTLQWTVEGDTGTLTLAEEARSSIPKLSDYGRGAVEILLPTSVPINSLRVRGDSGDVSADLSALRVERLELVTDGGDAVVRLPARDVMQGRLTVRGGDLELFVPEGMALDVKLEPGSGEPEYVYDSFRYDLLRDGELKRRNVDAFQYVLDVWLRDGARLVVTDGP
jgi:hypothetical protein